MARKQESLNSLKQLETMTEPAWGQWCHADTPAISLPSEIVLTIHFLTLSNLLQRPGDCVYWHGVPHAAGHPGLNQGRSTTI
jgi:hypothetical protein